jgi:L-seryl-tRNA(Ser) seleniumtransferase
MAIHPTATTVARPAAYGRGRILNDVVAEARKSTRGRQLVRERVLAYGKASIYNLTGLVRTFPLETTDLERLENQFTFYTHYLGRAEELALEYTGANPQVHGAVMCNRVSAAMAPIMLAALQRGDRVLSLVQKGRSHPSVQQGVELVGASFHEVQGLAALEQALQEGPWRMLVINPLTPSKYHVPEADVRRAAALAKADGLLVFIDDAHMMSRSIFFDEPPVFGLGEFDVAVWSLDKHVPGPRGAAIIGRKALIQDIAAQVFQFGLEPQSGHYVAMIRGMEAFDVTPLRQACTLARDLYQRFKPIFGDRVYQAAAGVALSAEDYTEVVFERAGTRHTSLVPEEIAITGCFLLLQHYGVITIPITGYPGAAPTFRLMMHPDGMRLGIEALEEAVDATIDRTAALLQHPDAVRSLLLGEASG